MLHYILVLRNIIYIIFLGIDIDISPTQLKQPLKNAQLLPTHKFFSLSHFSSLILCPFYLENLSFGVFLSEIIQF